MDSITGEAIKVLDENGNLFLHPRFDLAKINWREFNKYGKPSRIYYMNTLGYPHEQRAYGKFSFLLKVKIKNITTVVNRVIGSVLITISLVQFVKLYYF